MDTVAQDPRPARDEDIDSPELRASVFGTARIVDLRRQRLEVELLAAREALERRNHELQHANALLSATLDATPSALLVVELDGTVEHYNRPFERLCLGTGTAPDGSAAAAPALAPRHLDEALRAITAGLEAGADFSAWAVAAAAAPRAGCRTELAGRDGRQWLCEATPKHDGADCTGTVFVWTDVTEQRDNARLRAEAEAAHRANLEKSAFMSRASHELRTPLNAIVGFAQLVAVNPQVQGDAKLRQQVGHIHTASTHLNNLVDDMLTLTSLQVGGLRFHSERIDLVALQQDVVRLLEGYAGEREVAVQTALPALAWIDGDKTRVRQVMLNLLSNALKYNRRGGWVRIGLQAEGAKWQLSVQDGGIGMTAEQRAHLFEAFNRLGAERLKERGAGLGLVITRQIVMAMNGQLDVYSAPGLGSNFVVTWDAAA